MTAIDGLYSKNMFSFIRNCQTAFQSDYHFAFPPAMNEDFCCSHLCQHLVLSMFQIFATIIGMEWYLVVLI